MREGRQSQTARKVALNLLTLGQRPEWRARLGPELLDATREILLRSGAASEAVVRMAERPWALRIYEIMDPLLPGQLEAFGHRKRFFEAQVRDALAAGATQALILGAGFDSLALRLAKAHPEVTFVEVDHPATSTAKRRAIEAMGAPPSLHLVAADLGRVSLAEALGGLEAPSPGARARGAWDPGAMSVACAEGLTMYLSAEENLALLRSWAALSGPRSRLALTHVGLDDRGRPGTAGFAGWLMRASLRAIGEPFRWGIEAADLPAFVAPAGWRVLEERCEQRGLERLAVLERPEGARSGGMRS